MVAERWDTRRRVSQQNVDLVRQIWARWEGQNVAALVREQPPFEELPDELRTWLEEVYDPDVEVSWQAGPDSQIHRGHAGVVRSIAEWLYEWDEFYFAPKEFIDAGDDVIVPNIQRGRSKHGVELEQEFTTVFTIRRGRIVRIREYVSKENALKAVSLPK
jgi:ketosteroid isomerase-like protein